MYPLFEKLTMCVTMLSGRRNAVAEQTCRCGSSSEPIEVVAEMNAKVFRTGSVRTGPLETKAKVCLECGLTTFYARLDRLADWAGPLK